MQMIKNLSRRILLLTALYVSIIFGILALQFTSGGSFSLSIGSLMVSGSHETAPDGTETLSLPFHVGVPGLDFFVDDQNSLMAWRSATEGVPLRLVSMDKIASGVKLSFTDDVGVSFSAEKRGDSEIVTVSALMPEKYQRIALPYKIVRSAKVEKKNALTLVRMGKKQFSFSGAQIDAPGPDSLRRLSIQRSSPTVYYQTWIPAKGLVLADLSGLPGSSRQEYERAVDGWAASALVSFKDAIAKGNLNEQLVAAYVAEMGRIGMYSAAVESIPESWRAAPGRTWQTNTYFDNLVKTYAGLVVRERDDRTEISRKLTENNPSCFEFPGLVPYLVDRGSSVLLKDVARVAGTVDMETVTAVQAAGILEALMDYPVAVGGQDNPFLPLAESCERKIKGALVRIQGKLYLSPDGKTINSLESFRVAEVLIRYGTVSDPGWADAGRLLVSSLVSFAGDRAVLPASFGIVAGTKPGAQTGIVAKPDQVLDPARAYPAIVVSNTWFPHALSLAGEAGAGVWAWTCAQSIKISKTPDGGKRVAIRFPQGETHYLVMRGVKPFSRIVIYGMNFRSDPRYESYNSSGYVYNEETETLYLKMKHKAEYEDVILYPRGSAPQGTLSGPGPGPAGDTPPAPAVIQ